MKKNGTRLLSLLLILTMVLSFAPTAFAAEVETAAPAEEESYDSSWGTWEDSDPAEAPEEEEQPEEPAQDPVEEPAEEPAAEEEPALVEEPVAEEEPVEVAYPANTFFYVGGSGLRVTVDAPEGAFPIDARMVVNEVRPDAVQEVVTNAGVSGEVLIAADISFRDAEGAELEPEVPVEVAVTASMPKAKDLKVVHIDDDNNVEEVNQLPEGAAVNAASVQTASDARTLRFEAKSFSVYAVVGEGDTGDLARATVNFWKDTAKSENRATVYVKNSDTADELVKIVYDPGVGTLQPGQVFRGWTKNPNYTADTTPMTVSDIRTELEALDIKEGDVVDYYAMIFQIYNIAFQDEFNATIKTDKLYIRADGEAPAYTIKENYVPSDPNKKFDGWFVSVGSDKVSPVQEKYAVNTTVNISGNVVFTVNAPSGAWLSFNENGRGASYTPPEFVESGSTTTEPANPTRRGYTFDGWYTGAPATSGGDPTGSLFVFGQTLTARQDLYAKWKPVSTAPYTVIIWKQRATDDKNAADNAKTYDVWEVVTGLSGTVGSTINTVAQNGSAVNTGRGGTANNIRVNGTQYSEDGFHCNRFDQNVTIAPEGNTILNVYYDRNLITITFNTNNSYNSGIRNYYFDLGNGRVRSATVTGLFDAEIDFSWPSVAYSNTTTTTSSNVMWNSANGYGTLTFYGSYKLRVLSDVRDTYTMTNAGNSTVYFYRQNSDGTWPGQNEYSNSAAVNGSSFGLTNKYVGFTLYKYKSGAFVAADAQWTNAVVNANAPISNNRLNIRFTRDKYPITYFDGTYFDGNGTVLQAATRELIGQSGEIYYDADISSYDKGGQNYFVPGVIVSGYTFSGWYLDETCTKEATFDKMPLGGISVYAKWVQTQYRVFLHPNVPTTDTLEWGQTNQQMNFRVTNGEKISGGNVINGDRAGRTWELIGWFTDPSLANQYYFNFDTVLNDTTVTTPYDKTVDMTENADGTDMDKYGNLKDEGRNGDLNRPWITRKLDLWAKWREITVGAKGINVVYTATDDEGNTGTGAPNDTLDYLDNSESIAQGACKADDTTLQFMGWVLQTWDGSKYVDKTGAVINPGDPFTVRKADAKIIDNATGNVITIDEVHDGGSYQYLVQLRAEYQEFEAPDPTHITWYSNLQTVDGAALELSKFTHIGITDSEADKGWYVTDRYDDQGELDLQINEAVDIRPADTYAYTGMKFLGWAKSKTATANDLFLKWDAEAGKFYAQEVEGTGDWTVEVTQVAADERRPYDDLYAVWQAEFYVYHSGVAGGAIETIPYTSGTYDLTKTPEGLTAGTLYGGYYLEGGFTAPAAVDDVIPAYDGTNWTWSSAETVSGMAITPVPGETYYIKEVPAAKFLQAYTHFTYYLATGKIGSLFMISDIDDLNYSQTGFVVQETNGDAKVYRTLTIEAKNTGKTVTFKPNTVFYGKAAATNYLTCRDITNDDVAGKNIVQYWVTPDGLIVTGTVSRVLTNLETKGSITCVTSAVTTTIKVFS